MDFQIQKSQSSLTENNGNAGISQANKEVTKENNKQASSKSKSQTNGSANEATSSTGVPDMKTVIVAEGAGLTDKNRLLNLLILRKLIYALELLLLVKRLKKPINY